MCESVVSIQCQLVGRVWKQFQLGVSRMVVYTDTNFLGRKMMMVVILCGGGVVIVSFISSNKQSNYRILLHGLWTWVYKVDLIRFISVFLKQP